MAVCGNEDGLIGIFSGLIPEGEFNAYKKKKKNVRNAKAHTHTHSTLPPLTKKSLTITTCTSNETNSVCSLLHKAELHRQSGILNTIKTRRSLQETKFLSLLAACLIRRAANGCKFLLIFGTFYLQMPSAMHERG